MMGECTLHMSISRNAFWALRNAFWAFSKGFFVAACPFFIYLTDIMILNSFDKAIENLYIRSHQIGEH